MPIRALFFATVFVASMAQKTAPIPADPPPAPTPSFLSQGQGALKNGDAESALPLLNAALKILETDKDGAQALYLMAVAQEQLGKVQQAKKTYQTCLSETYEGLFSRRLLKVIKGKVGKKESARSLDLASLIHSLSEESSAKKSQQLIAFASQSTPDMPGLRASMAAAETALEHGQFFRAKASSKLALNLASALPPLPNALQHTLDIVTKRSFTEARRLRWAWGAGISLLGLFVLTLFKRPLKTVHQEDWRPILLHFLNLLFAIFLFVGFYKIGANPSENSPLTAPRMAKFMSVMTLGSLLGIGLTLGFRKQRNGAALAMLLGAVGLLSCLYLFAWSEDYLPAFFL